MMVSYVPVTLWRCPAFMACVWSVNGVLRPMNNHHGKHSMMLEVGAAR
ncbi:MAG: hypothetical protein RLP27_06280 [Rhodospirillales bacterium]